MLGALAASGGTAGASSGLGPTRCSTYLARRMARGGGRLVRGGARATGSAVDGAAKGSVMVGKIGLKSTLGLPVYGPRVARRTSAAITALPDRAASGVADLGQRLQTIHQQYAPAVQDFTGEYVHNVRSLGRFVTGRGGSGPYVPRPRTAQRTPLARAAVRPPASAAPRPRLATPSPTPTPAQVVVRRRPVPWHQQQPPATAAHAALHRRLHRIRNAQPSGGRPPQRLPGGRP